MILGKSDYSYNPKIDNQPLEIHESLRTLGVTLDRNLDFKQHIDEILKKSYGMIAALRRLKRMVPINIITSLYKAYVLPNMEYCSQLLIGVNKTLCKKLEKANCYGLRTVMNLGNNITYDELLELASMRSLQRRRLEQSLILFFKSFRNEGPVYISDFFKRRKSTYNLRHNGLNFDQDRNNNRYLHNSYSYIVGHEWNNSPLPAKSASTLAEFKLHLKHCEFIGCQCQSCI